MKAPFHGPHQLRSGIPSRIRRIALLAAMLATMPVAVLWAPRGHAEEIDCVTTKWQMIGKDHRICVEAFDDPRIEGVACHLSQARSGGLSASFGLAEDPNLFALECSQVGPITLPPSLPRQETVFSSATAALFKETRVVRMLDIERNTLIYLVFGTRLIEGYPLSSISTVPIKPWGAGP